MTWKHDVKDSEYICQVFINKKKRWISWYVWGRRINGQATILLFFQKLDVSYLVNFAVLLFVPVISSFDCILNCLNSLDVLLRISEVVDFLTSVQMFSNFFYSFN